METSKVAEFNKSLKSDPTYKYFYNKYGNGMSTSEAKDYKNKLIQFFSLLVEIDQRNSKFRKEVKQYARQL